MASGHNDPKLLYAIPGVTAYHLSHGKETPLTPGGPQTLSLLMVPTTSPFADLNAVDPNSETPEEDFYLHLHLPPELDIPLPATTQIYHQPPTSYLIPRWDLGPESGTFTRLEFPDVGTRKGLQEDVDTFETILAQCTAFLERSPPPKIARRQTSTPSSSKTSPTMSKAKLAAADGPPPPYNPASFAPGEAYAKGSHSLNPGGQIVLVDEENGSVIGELGEGYQVVEDTALNPGSKDPVEITLPQEGQQAIAVAPASQEYIEMELHPAYKKSFLVSKAAYASRLIVTTSDFVSKQMQGQADTFTQKTKPNNKPVTFTPATHDRVRKISSFTGGAAGLSAKTVGQVSKVAQNLGAAMAGKKKDGGSKGFMPDGTPRENYKPGLLNKSLMAFSTIADGIDQAGRNLLAGSSSAATTVVQHKWGDEAGNMSRNLGGSVKNVGLVYIDVTGVSRKAIIKAVGKGMVVGKVKGGGEVIVGGGDGGVLTLPPPDYKGGAAGSDSASIKSSSNGKKPYYE